MRLNFTYYILLSFLNLINLDVDYKQNESRIKMKELGIDDGTPQSLNIPPPVNPANITNIHPQVNPPYYQSSGVQNVKI